MYKRQHTTPRSTKVPKKALLLVAALLGAAFLVGAVLEMTGRINLLQDSKSQQQPAPGSINYDPPTEAEKEAGDKQKEEIVREEDAKKVAAPPPSSQPTANNKKAVKPIIISAGGGDVRGFIPGITENSGTCTAKFTSGTQTVTRTSSAVADAQNTTCTPLNYTDTAVGAGWSVTLTYESNSSEGTSDVGKVQ